MESADGKMARTGWDCGNWEGRPGYILPSRLPLPSRLLADPSVTADPEQCSLAYLRGYDPNIACLVAGIMPSMARKRKASK